MLPVGSLSGLLSVGSAPDLLRLLAVPVFGWAAWLDIRTRRVPNRTWKPLLVLGLVALVWEGWLVYSGTTPTYVNQNRYLFRVAFSLGFIVPLAYGFWWIGGFGGADAKALITLALLFPTFPTYLLPTMAFPQVVPTLGVFSMTVLSNTVVIGIAYPFVLMLRNGLLGHFGKAMFVGRPITWDAATEEYGRLLEDPDGFTRGGMDLDALRMYLQWRGLTLSEIRADPDRYRDPRSLPADPNPAGDGSIPVTDGGHPGQAATRGTLETPDGDADTAAWKDRAVVPEFVARDDGAVFPEFVEPVDDDWGAEAFLEDIPGTAYGTSPEELRGGLEVLTTEETVWLTPGVPFLVPMFVGLVVSLTYGDVLYAALGGVAF
ncbi:prepilin peptidase [Halorientalis salina]|uniref:prepilin peptidase n=1 Tax=Halorientalis salina TaxID=2932266 RepID=UPI0010AD18E9|nr:prepilin peptidase [Halorientalis salina]